MGEGRTGGRFYSLDLKSSLLKGLKEHADLWAAVVVIMIDSAIKTAFIQSEVASHAQ